MQKDSNTTEKERRRKERKKASPNKRRITQSQELHEKKETKAHGKAPLPEDFIQCLHRSKLLARSKEENSISTLSEGVSC